MGSILPQDVFFTIFRLIPDSYTLFNLLLVNRRFHNLVEPILYRDVVLALTYHPDYIPTWIKSFRRSVTYHNARRAPLVHSLRIPLAEGINVLFPYLPRLRRLGFVEAFGSYPKPDELFSSLKSLTNLTHLLWRTPIEDVRAFSAFLEASPSIEYLNFRCNDREIEGFELADDALPRLEWLGANIEQALMILPGRRVKHLELYLGTGELKLPLEEEYLDVVETLSCSIDFGDNLHYLVEAASQFKNLRYLEFYSMEDDLSVAGISQILMPLSVTTVQYISIILEVPSFNGHVELPHDVHHTFEDIPTLRIFDVEEDGQAYDQPGMFFRYRRGDTDGPILVDRIKRDYTRWDPWFEDCLLGELNAPLEA
ncbi:hypothetical protein ONZ45_g13175 [Pleurotus djamor]|nr:hypothetical protein ONZ45_g13175 [Pleurotus djamor]